MILVGGTRYRLPLDEALTRKLDAMATAVDLRVIAVEAPGSTGIDARMRLVRASGRVGGRMVPLLLPLALRREWRRRPADVVVAESPHHGFLAMLGLAGARPPARLVVEVHGDWRVATRLYGSAARRLLGPLADRAARRALRRADAVRAVSAHLARLVEAESRVRPHAVFAAFSDLEVFATPPQPPPGAPRVLYVGALEMVKGIDVLLRAWPAVAARCTGARLELVGDGRLAPLVRRLEQERDDVRRHPVLPPAGVAARMDAATLLTLPSRSEGLPRVLIEAQARGRAVVASDVGGIPELIGHGENGLLVPPGDHEALAHALVEILADRDTAARMGRDAHRRYAALHTTPAEFARSYRELVDRAITS